MKWQRENELECKLFNDARTAQDKLDFSNPSKEERNRLLDKVEKYRAFVDGQHLGEDLTELTPLTYLTQEERQSIEDEGEKERVMACLKCGTIISYGRKHTYPMCIDCTAEAVVIDSEIDPVERQKLDELFFKEFEDLSF